jgi:predicted RNase H-like HicB family nuclease
VRGKCFPACSISRPRILPSAPGLSHAGKTYEAAVKHGEEALIGFLEALQMNGEVIPVERPSAPVSHGLFVELPTAV